MSGKNPSLISAAEWAAQDGSFFAHLRRTRPQTHQLTHPSTHTTEKLKADKQFQEALKKFNAPASKADLDATVKALEGKKHHVKVVKNGAEAQAFLASLLKDGVSISMGHSTTLAQIGFVDYVKTQDARITNYKGKAVEAQSKGDMAGYGENIAKGNLADFYFSSVSAVTKEGDIVGVDLTGTRIGGWLTAKQLVLVLGSNKIVADKAEAVKRIAYQFDLESARCRVAYGVPGSGICNESWVHSSNPYGSRVHVVIIEESLGY